MSMTQDSLGAKSAQLQSHVNELLGIVGGAIDQQLPIHEVESKLQRGFHGLPILGR